MPGKGSSPNSDPIIDAKTTHYCFNNEHSRLSGALFNTLRTLRNL
jgi:hypothetical protein